MNILFRFCLLSALAPLLWISLLPLSLHAAELLENQIRLLAEQGNAEAQFSLGLQYDTGNGAQRDPEQAFYWFSRAAEQGIAGACLYLGMKYEFGTGVGRDLQLAKQWYRQAALQGWPQAAFMLASLYLSSEPGDPVQGCAWITIAQGQDFPGADALRKQYCLALSPSNSRRVEQRIDTIKATLPH